MVPSADANVWALGCTKQAGVSLLAEALAARLYHGSIGLSCMVSASVPC